MPAPADIQEILDLANKLGDLVAKHPAIGKFKEAQKSIAADPDAGRLLAEFDRQIETLQRQESQGMPVTDAQRRTLETLQSQIMSHIKIKNLNMAQVEMYDILRRVNQAWQGKLTDGTIGAPGAKMAQ